MPLPLGGGSREASARCRIRGGFRLFALHLPVRGLEGTPPPRQVPLLPFRTLVCLDAASEASCIGCRSEVAPCALVGVVAFAVVFNPEPHGDIQQLSVHRQGEVLRSGKQGQF